MKDRKIEVLEVNQDYNGVYVAQYSSPPFEHQCTNTVYDLQKMETDLGIIFRNGRYDSLTFMVERELVYNWYVSPQEAVNKWIK